MINDLINGNGIKAQQRENTFVKEKATTKTTTVKAKAKEKTLEQEVFEYIKTKEAYPLISGEWLSKQEKLGKTFLQLKPRIDDLIEEFLETEKRVKEAENKEIELSEHDKALIEGNYKIEGKPENISFLQKEKPVLKVKPESTDKESLTVQKEAWRTEEYEKTVNELKERFGMLNPM